MPALGDEPWDGGWLEPLNRALYPPVDARRNGDARTEMSGVQVEGHACSQRPNDETGGAVDRGARPARVCRRATPSSGGIRARSTWHEKPPFGVRREDLIVKDVPRNVVADGRGAYDRWRARPRAMRATPARSRRIVCALYARLRQAETVTSPPDITIVDLRDASDGERAGGLGFGRLVHELLARVSFDAPPETVVDLALVHARLLDLTDDDARAAASVAGRVLASDLLKRARAANQRGTCRRETPVMLRDADESLVEGTVDLAFEESGRWTVVDFKTDREAVAGTPAYVRQVQLYTGAVAAATGAPARAVILQV